MYVITDTMGYYGVCESHMKCGSCGRTYHYWAYGHYEPEVPFHKTFGTVNDIVFNFKHNKRYMLRQIYWTFIRTVNQFLEFNRAINNARPKDT